jgi:hypothetical protein
MSKNITNKLTTARKASPKIRFSIEGTEDEETGRMSAIIEVVRD